MTFNELKYTLLSRVRADASSPSVNNLDDANIKRWFIEINPLVIRLLKAPEYFQSLIVFDESVTISSGSAVLSGLDEDYAMAVSAKVGTEKISAELTFDPVVFNAFDSKSWLTTPVTDFPIVLVTATKIFVKPTDSTRVYLDYIKEHPDVTDGTVWHQLADSVAIELLAAKYFDFRGYPDRAQAARNNAMALIPGEAA